MEHEVRQKFEKRWQRSRPGLASWHRFEGKWEAAWCEAGSFRLLPLARFKETLLVSAFSGNSLDEIRHPLGQSFSRRDLCNTCPRVPWKPAFLYAFHIILKWFCGKQVSWRLLTPALVE